MFEQTVMLLLAGEFVCRVSHPEEFRYLENDEHRQEIDEFVGKISRRLVATSHQSGFYLAYARCGEDERTAIRAYFGEIKSNLAPVIGFFHTIMRATGQEDLLMHGATLETSTIMAQIDQDAGLRNELQMVATQFKTISADGSHRSMFEKVLKRMKDAGYLCLVNAERGLYQVTAKVEYLLEVVTFLQENDETMKGALDEDSESETARLL